MESAAVAALAWQARIPFLSVRVIVDSHLETLPQAVIGALDPEGRQRSLRFLGTLLKRPTELPAATRMLGYWRAAQRTLRWVAQRAGPHLQAP